MVHEFEPKIKQNLLFYLPKLPIFITFPLKITQVGPQSGKYWVY